MRKTAAKWMTLLALAGLGLGGCSGSGSGPVRLGVDLVIERCPLIASWNASPLQATVPNGVISVAATVQDVPEAGAQPLELMWTATAGAFDNPTFASTTYHCTTAGNQVLTFSAVDKHRRVPCADVTSISVTCKK
jgi:hypothetical protein